MCLRASLAAEELEEISVALCAVAVLFELSAVHVLVIAAWLLGWRCRLWRVFSWRGRGREKDREREGERERERGRGRGKVVLCNIQTGLLNVETQHLSHYTY